jgi:hypothetical protein
VLAAVTLAVGVTVVSLSSRSAPASAPSHGALALPDASVARAIDPTARNAEPIALPMDGAARLSAEPVVDASPAISLDRDAQTVDARASRRPLGARAPRNTGGCYVLE